MPGLFNDSDDSDDSDSNIVDQSKRKRSSMSMDIAKSSDGGGSVFRDVAAKFQANVRKRSNNVWGSILQEDALVSEMTGTGVGRTLKVKLNQF